MTTLALAAIVRNEEHALSRMIESAAEGVDEIVIVDTGSTDKTLEIARRYTDKVFIHPWENSFAKARNHAMDHCESDWILFLDADELVESGTIQSIKDSLDKFSDKRVILLRLVMCDEHGNPDHEFAAERLIRNIPSIRWRGDMHNWVDSPEDDTRIIVPDWRIIHDRTIKPAEEREARARQRLEMAESIFLPKIEADPKDRRSLFYLAGTYMDSGEVIQAAKYLQQYMEVSEWNHERYQAALMLGTCYRSMGERDAAKRMFVQAMLENWKRAEVLNQLGEMAIEDNDFEQAEMWFKRASLMDKPVDPLFVQVADHTWLPHMGLWYAYNGLGRHDLANTHLLKAEELGAPPKPEVCKWRKNHSLYNSMRICFLVDRGQTNFADPIIRHLRSLGKNVSVVTNAEEVPECDIVWCEWAGEECVKFTHMEKTARVIVRVLGYEVYTGIIENVNWENVDDVIFISRHLKEIALCNVPEIEALANTYVVHGGVDTNGIRITSPDHPRDGQQVVILGYVNQRKNLPLALQILAANPKKTLHIVGQWQDVETLEYFTHMAHRMHIADRVKVHGRVENLTKFFADKDFILSTSIRETMHYSVGEGMAAGLKPVVHWWPSAEEYYPRQNLFTSISEASAMLDDPGNPLEWRQEAVENLAEDTMLKRVDRVLRRPCIGVAGPNNTQWSLEYKLARAFEEIGCRTDMPKPEGVLMIGAAPRVESWMRDIPRVLWHVEQVVGDDEHAAMRQEQVMPVIESVDVVLAHTPESAEWFKSTGLVKDVKCVDLVRLYEPFKPADLPKEFDVGFCGCMNERRHKILNRLSKYFDVHVLENGDHEQVNAFFNRCKIVLNLHYTDEPNLEQRIGEALSTRACVVSELLCQSVPGVTQCAQESLVKTIKRLLGDESERQRLGDEGYCYVARRPLTDVAEIVLDCCGIA